MFTRGKKVAVLTHRGWMLGLVDAPPLYGYVGIGGLTGYAGVVSVPTRNVTLFHYLAARGRP